MNALRIFIFGALLLPQIVYAQQPIPESVSYGITSLRADIKIAQNGEVEVVEKFSLTFPSSTFFWVFDSPVSKLEVKIAGAKLSKKDYKVQKEQEGFRLIATTEKPSQSWELRYKTTESVKPDRGMSNYDRFYLVLVSAPGVYIQNLIISVRLPQPIQKDALKQRIYAIRGVASNDFYQNDPQTLIYTGAGLSSIAIFTIEAKWPSGIITYTPIEKGVFIAQIKSFEFWLLASVSLPLLALLFYVYMLVVQKRNKKLVTIGYTDQPPENLPPALVGVLLREQVSQREIVATLIDLARRGFVDIVQKREEYVLGKRRGEGELKPFELMLYDKLFTQQGERKIKRTELELERRAMQQLYSPKVSTFYRDIYSEVQKKNYFIKNPAEVVLKYRIFGILFFISAAVTAILAAKFSSGPPFGILGSFGQMLAASLIIKIAPFMPKRTKLGEEALARWLSFRRFLADKKPLKLPPWKHNLFDEYLPYAVALGVEIDWSARFREIPYVPPAWFVSEEEEITLESFVGSLFYVTNSLSQALYGLREPDL